MKVYIVKKKTNVYIVFSNYIHEDSDYFEEVFSTKEKAEQYIKEATDTEEYDYWILEKEVK